MKCIARLCAGVKNNIVREIQKSTSWSKGTPLTSVLFAICRAPLLTSCAVYVSSYTRLTLQDQATPLKSPTIDLKSARKVLSSPSFEPRQELVMSVVNRMKDESNRRTTKAQMMYKNRAATSRKKTTVMSWKPENKATVTALNAVNQATVRRTLTVTIWNSMNQQQQSGRQL
jgi:hypothetical protein